MSKNLSEKQIVVYSTVWCPDCKRAKKFFGEQRVPYVNIDIEQDPEAMAYVEKVNNGMRIIPTIVFPDGTILSEPSDAQLAEKLGITTQAKQSFYDAIIVGGGPAGLTGKSPLPCPMRGGACESCRSTAGRCPWPGKWTWLPGPRKRMAL